MKIFNYKQKIFLKILILLTFIIIAFASYQMQDKTEEWKVYSMPGFYILLVVIELILYLYDSSRKIAVDQDGLYFIILWKIPWGFIPWDKIEEGYIVKHNTAEEISNDPYSFIKPFSAIQWFGARALTVTIQLIVKNDMPESIHLGDIKKPAELEKIIRENVKIVKK